MLSFFMKYVKPLKILEYLDDTELYPDADLLALASKDEEIPKGGGDKEVIYELIKRKLFTIEEISKMGYRKVVDSFIILFNMEEFGSLLYYLNTGGKFIIDDIVENNRGLILNDSTVNFLLKHEP